MKVDDQPENWANFKLLEIAAGAGQSVTPQDFPEETFDLFSVPAFENLVPEQPLGKEIKSNKQSVDPSNVLLCKIVPHLNRVWTVPDKGSNRQIASGEWVRYDTSGLDPEYIRLALSAPEFRAEFMTTISGVGGSLTRARPQMFNQFDIPLPPLAEQRRIVEKLDQLSARTRAAKDHLAHVQTLATRAKQATLAAAFRGELSADWRSEKHGTSWSKEKLALLNQNRVLYQKKRRGSRLTSDSGLTLDNLGELPYTWQKAHLAEITQLQTGYAFKSKWFSDKGPLLVRGANVAPGQVCWDDTKRLDPNMAADYEEYRLNAGDIVLAMDRPVISTGLKIAVVDEGSAGALLVQRVAKIVAQGLTTTHFVWHLMNSKLFLDHALDRATGGDLPHISANDILTTPVPLPPLEEQAEIVRRIEAAFARIDRMVTEATRAAELLERLEAQLLTKAFRGELVPQDPADEPASVLLARIREARASAPKPKRTRKRSQP